MNVLTTAGRVVFQGRRLANSEIKRFAQLPHQRVLEVGSGEPGDGSYPYSARRFFPDADFTQTEIDPDFGLPILDVRSDSLDGYDTILCVSVLEHVYEWEKAVANLASVRDGTRVFVIVPAFYPLHAEPYDFWRFSEHALRRMFVGFSSIEVRWRGPIRQFPTIYSVTLVR